ncbi:hypothetical protein QBC46DRAFT_430296 [Diplogelasinospora grovesii]|uniref:Uncharacterized protein n=1 Tax=Diplogelasinospora grovesii TaxID=303347 RepID=A0AAN6S9Q4_9PEZI|nr:hypothetical protein QBC46DRAFT_430296 [Diplogelasinospora grovesii]
MTAISLFRLGFDDYYNNPKTVYVTVGYESAETGWPPVEQKMQAFLDKFHFDLHVHLEHNTIGHSAFPLLPTTLTQAERIHRIRDFNYGVREKYETLVNAGADMSAGCHLTRVDGQPSNPMVGTLGCRTVALTNYHVVRPAV